MRKGTIIGLSIAGGVVVISAIVVGIVLAATLGKEPFAKTDGVVVNATSGAPSICISESANEALDFYQRTSISVSAYPIEKGWNLDEKIELSDKYTEDGYPVYIHSWNGKYKGTKIRYECYIRTSYTKQTVLWVKQGSSKIITHEDVLLYDKDGNRLYSDN